MADFPNQAAIPVTVWTGDARHGLAVGSRAVAAGSAQFASTAWGTANLAIYTPILLPYTYTIKNFFVYNFATVAGNVDIGIYSEDLSLIFSKGSTAMAGASTMQFFSCDLMVPPGTYYIGFVSSSTTATFGAAAVGSATRERYMGLLQQALGATTLPNTITPAAVGQARIPQVGFTWQSSPTF